MSSLTALNKLMPSDVQFKSDDGPLTKDIMNVKLRSFARKHPDMYAKNIHHIRELGEELAYVSGHNMGLSDLKLGNQKSIDKKLSLAEQKMKSMSPEMAKKHLINTFDSLQKDVMKNSDNNLVSQAVSKGRGNPSQVARTSAGVVYAVDMNSEPYPFMIKNSLSKGLRSHEQFASGGQSRFAAVQAAVSTSEPGAMGKVLIANTEGIRISEKDCGTTNGISINLSTNDALGRYEARSNRLIDQSYMKKLLSSGKRTVIARSPITCKSKNGVCSMCMGKNEKGAMPTIGHNVGIEAAQSVSEKATQLILSAKHNVAGKSGGSSIPTGFKAAKIALNSTDSYPGKATVSQIGGVIQKVDKLHTGGYNINVSGVDHVVSHSVDPKVRVGMRIDRGDVMTNGLASTKDIVNNRGILEARMHLTNELDKANNGSIDRRNLEVISRGYLGLVKPKSSPGFSDLRSFDSFVPTLEGTHVTNMGTRDKQITKKFLAEPILAYSPGRQITKSIANDIAKNGIKNVKVSHSALPYEAIFKTYEQMPLANNSLWQKMNYRGIKKGILDALSFGDKEDTSNIRSDRAKFTLGIL